MKIDLKAVSQILIEIDPIGLIGSGAPKDEYEPEAKSIMLRIDAQNSLEEINNIVYEEFIKWFDKDIAGEREKYIGAAVKIWDMLQNIEI
jgi:hypothetical protein